MPGPRSPCRCPGCSDNATYNGDAAAVLTGIGTIAGTVSFDGSTLSWAGDVPAAGSVTLTYSVTVNSPDTTGNQILASTVTSASTGSNCGSGSADPRCTTTVTVSALAIDAAFSPAAVTPGGTVVATTTITNTGQTPYYGISVTFTSANTPAQLTSVGNQVASSGTLSVGTYRGGVDRGRPGRRDGDDHRLADRR